MSQLVVGLLLVLVLVASPAGAQRRVEVSKVRARIAEELLPLAETATGSAASVTLDRGSNSLVLVGDPEAVAAAIALLARQDRLPRGIVIRFESMRASQLAARGYDVRWRIARGDLRIGSVHARSVEGSSFGLHVEERMRRLTDSFAATLRVTEGARTRIEAGTSVPFGVTGSGGAGIEYVDASTGFEASARLLSDGRVRIDLASVAAEPPDADGWIESSSAATQLLLSPGETLAIAGLDRSRGIRRTRRLEAEDSASRRDEILWLVHADVE